MKYSSLKAFEKHLESAAPIHLSRIYTLFIKDKSDRTIALQKLLSFLVPKEKQAQTMIKTFDSASVSLIEELETFPLFAKNRVVIVNDISSIKNIKENLETYLKKPDPITYLVLLGDTSAKNSLLKSLEKYGVILEVPEEKPWEKERSTQEWLFLQAEKLQKKLSPQACQMILQRIGTDKLFLSTELEKLATYIGERLEITTHDVEVLTPSIQAESHWQLNDAIFKRDAKVAFRIAKGLLADGWAFIKLVRHLRSQFQTAFQVASFLEKGQIAHIKERFPQMKDFTIQKHLEAVKYYGTSSFPKALQAIDKAELMFKDGVDNSELLTDLLLAKLIL